MQRYVKAYTHTYLDFIHMHHSFELSPPVKSNLYEYMYVCMSINEDVYVLLHVLLYVKRLTTICSTGLLPQTP
jgi:hypothetical protein